MDNSSISIASIKLIHINILRKSINGIHNCSSVIIRLESAATAAAETRYAAKEKLQLAARRVGPEIRMRRTETDAIAFYRKHPLLL